MLGGGPYGFLGESSRISPTGSRELSGSEPSLLTNLSREAFPNEAIAAAAPLNPKRPIKSLRPIAIVVCSVTSASRTRSALHSLDSTPKGTQDRGAHETSLGRYVIDKTHGELGHRRKCATERRLINPDGRRPCDVYHTHHVPRMTVLRPTFDQCFQLPTRPNLFDSDVDVRSQTSEGPRGARRATVCGTPTIRITSACNVSWQAFCGRRRSLHLRL